MPINGADYINASYITGDGFEDMLDENVRDDPDDPSRWSNINFIACQGPLPETTVHHLQMIFENKIDIVVNVCDKKSESTYLK